MENESRLKRWMGSAGDWLNDQSWFQELRAKWDELDAQSRLYLKGAAAGAAGLLVLSVLLSSLWSVRSLRNEFAEKSELLNTLQNATTELRRLRETSAAGAGGPGTTEGGEAGAWPAFFESVAAQTGIAKESLTVSTASSGASSEQTKELLYDLTVKKANIRQLVRFAFQLEGADRPVKLRNLALDTQAGASGYLDAVLSVSAFTVSASAK